VTHKKVTCCPIFSTRNVFLARLLPKIGSFPCSPSKQKFRMNSVSKYAFWYPLGRFSCKGESREVETSTFQAPCSQSSSRASVRHSCGLKPNNSAKDISRLEVFRVIFVSVSLHVEPLRRGGLSLVKRGERG
jgi:hypothetical protein